MRIRRFLRFSAAGLLGILLIAIVALQLAADRRSADFADAVHGRRVRQAAVLLSGDIGFLGASPRVARAVETTGLPVYAVSSLAAFRERKTIPQTVAIIERAVNETKARYGADKVLLVGHSFGADAVGAALPDLSPEVRNSLLGVVLIVPSDRVYLRADPSTWSYRGPPDASLDRVRSVNWVRILCIYGLQERDSLCPSLHGPKVRVVGLAGGHGLNHGAKLAETLRIETAKMLGQPRN